MADEPAPIFLFLNFFEFFPPSLLRGEKVYNNDDDIEKKGKMMGVAGISVRGVFAQ